MPTIVSEAERRGFLKRACEGIMLVKKGQLIIFILYVCTIYENEIESRIGKNMWIKMYYNAME